MNTHANKKKKNQAAAARKISRTPRDTEPVLRTEQPDFAPANFQDTANNSSHTSQLHIIQKMVDNSVVSKKHERMVNIANDRPQADIIQRYPEQMDDDSAKALGSFYSSEHSDKKDDDFTHDELAEIKSGVFMLTDLAPKNMSANCIGWALGMDNIEDPGNMYLWENKKMGDLTPTEPDAGDARIILWGNKDSDDENDWEVLHASVLLTHSEIAARSKRFSGFSEITTQALSEAGIDDPCWTSVGGFGFGAIVHPRDWLEGGAFGTALKGMK